MKLRDIVELAFQRFRTRSLRFVLTILGVGVGIGVVFFLVSLGFGLQEIVIGRIATSDSLVSLTVSLPEEAVGLLTISPDTLGQFRELEHVQDVSPVLSVPTEMSFKELRAQTLTQAVQPSYFRYSGIEATGGELFGEDATETVVVSTTVLRLFGLTQQSVLGTEINLSFVVPNPPESAEEFQVISFGRPFRIVGYIESETNSIFAPLKVFEELPSKNFSQVKVRIDHVDNINGVREVLIKKGFNVVALTDTLDQLNQIFRVTQASLATLGIIALFISSVGMFNTLTISLLERTHEVGILKAIGATNKDVWMIFLYEAVLIGILGGVAGVAGGFLFARIVNFLVNLLAQRYGGEAVDIFRIPLWFIIMIISISLGVGLITGLYPARRAAHINPLKALKNE